MPSQNNSISRPTTAAYPGQPTNRLRTRSPIPVYTCSGRPDKWVRLAQSHSYGQRIKRAIEMVKTYRLVVTGSDYLDRMDRDAIHDLIDPFTFESGRRNRTDGGARDVTAK